ncbi:MAG: DUF547 domain-containing protein [Pseudomonadota bacterium]
MSKKAVTFDFSNSLRNTTRAALFGIALISFPLANAQAELPERLQPFAAFDATQTYKVDYSPWSTFTGAFANERRGKVTLAYATIAPQGIEFLKKYIGYLQNFPVTKLNKNEQLAYWLNLHNTLAVFQQVNNYKKSTPEELIQGRAWQVKLVRVEGVTLSLKDIEAILFENFDDPKVLYGLCFGTRSGPSLRMEPFTGDTVSADLDDAARRFVNSRSEVNVRKGTVTLSEYYSWFKDEAFDGSDEKLLKHVSTYAASKKMAAIDASGGLAFNKFNYRLAEHKPRTAPPASASPLGGGGGGAFPAGS